MEHQAFAGLLDQLKVQVLNVMPLCMNGKMQALFDSFPLTVLQDAFFLVLYPERKTGVGLTYYLVSKFESRNINRYIPSSGHKLLQKPKVCHSESVSTDVAHQNPSEPNLVQDLYVVLESLNGIMHGFFEENL